MPRISVGSDNFQIAIRDFTTSVRENIRLSVISLATEIYRELQLTTPVLTGVAEVNWRVSLDGANDASWLFSSPRVRPPRQVYGEDESSVILGYEPGETITIYNNVPYLGLLNDGSSSKAPAGFVELAVATAVANFNIGLL